MNRNIKILISTLIVLIMAAIAGYYGYAYYRYTKLNLTARDGEQHGYYVYPDTPLSALLDSIAQDYIIASPRCLKRDIAKVGITAPKVGYYKIPAAIGDKALLTRFLNGQQTPVHISFTTYQRNREQLSARIAKYLLTDSAAIFALLDSTEYLQQFGVNKQTAICLFLPDTYEVYWTITPEQLIERMYKEYTHFWTDQRKQQAAKLGLTPNEVYTLASIVASETNKDFEYPIIAGLYLNRLRLGMNLQACPTAVFATGKFGARRITKEMTSFPSPYNTYIHPGLPPGPIRATRKPVIDSTLNATHSHYLYMCANPDFSGTHVFSTSYQQHAQVARQYQRELNRRRILK